MALRNGRLPKKLLRAVPYAAKTFSTAIIRRAAYNSLKRLMREYKRAWGDFPYLNEGYRDYATQLRYWNDPNVKVSARPGTSVHGWGTAIDIGGLSGFNSERYKWLAKYAALFGWYQPAVYQRDGKYPEYWHWEHDAGRDTMGKGQARAIRSARGYRKPGRLPWITRKRGYLLKWTTSVLIGSEVWRKTRSGNYYRAVDFA